jgi:hypothetical protein
MIFPDAAAQKKSLTHALVVVPAPNLAARTAFIKRFSTDRHAWFIRSSIQKHDGSARIYFRVPTGTAKDTIERIVRTAEEAFVGASVYVQPLPPK